MAPKQIQRAVLATGWTCTQCLTRARQPSLPVLLQRPSQRKRYSSTKPSLDERQIKAAPELNFSESQTSAARIIPASASYFSASPVFNDNLLLLESLVKSHSSLPTASGEQSSRTYWMTLSQYRSSTGEKITASKYSKVVSLLTRLNKIHSTLRPPSIVRIIEQFRRPGSTEVEKAKPGEIDEYGRSKGIGRRKESAARVYLVEGTGEVLINGRGLLQVFPRLHDRESALWPLKITQRMDKYNVFGLVEGGGITGQAESITLALTRALLVQEPALKPALRRAGCVTSDARRVERKKPGHRKARKMPQWVKR